jgi:mono/diheme cytochrome c family protein
MILPLLFLQLAARPDLELGRKIFDSTCAVGYCHGAGGTANRGPRLRGRGFDRGYVDRVVRRGLPNTAMPGFEGRLGNTELEAVIEYVMSLNTGRPAEPGDPTAAPTGAAPAPVAAVLRPHPGQALFFDATREVRCGTCHEVNGMGVHIAPSPASAILPAAVRRVRRARLKNNESFPALPAGERDGFIQLYDLSVPPPVLRTIEKSELLELAPETSWNHAAVMAGYTPQELEQVLDFLKTLR